MSWANVFEADEPSDLLVAIVNLMVSDSSLTLCDVQDRLNGKGRFHLMACDPPSEPDIVTQTVGGKSTTYAVCIIEAPRKLAEVEMGIPYEENYHRLKDTGFTTFLQE